MGVRPSRRAALLALVALSGVAGWVVWRATQAPGPRLVAVDVGEGLPRSGQWRQGFALADVDGDGVPELLHGPPRKGEAKPVIFRRAADGRWARWSAARFAPLRYAYGDAAVADFDGDGNADLALAMHVAPPVLLRGDGSGAFEPFAADLGAAVPGFSSRAAAVVDWNGDGRADLALLGEGPTGLGRGPRPAGVRIVTRGDDGTWHVEALPGRAPLNFGDSMAAGDLDGDGRADLAVSSGRMGRRDLAHLSGRGGAAVEIDCLGERALARAVAIVELDAAPPAELIVAQRRFDGATWTSTVYAARWRDERWECRPLVDGVAADVRAVAAGDADGDGAADVAFTDGNGRLRLLLGDNRGAWREAHLQMPAPSGCAGHRLAFADLDGDGRDEIVASFAGEPERDRCASGGAIAAWRFIAP
jgi:FG-GAP-like repeat/FG-GAP repeat